MKTCRTSLVAAALALSATVTMMAQGQGSGQGSAGGAQSQPPAGGVQAQAPPASTPAGQRTPAQLKLLPKAIDAPDIKVDVVKDFMKLPPNVYMGEGIGVATNSKGHIF